MHEDCTGAFFVRTPPQSSAGIAPTEVLVRIGLGRSRRSGKP